jgi:hypothetical protein
VSEQTAHCASSVQALHRRPVCRTKPPSHQLINQHRKDIRSRIRQRLRIGMIGGDA